MFEWEIIFFLFAYKTLFHFVTREFVISTFKHIERRFDAFLFAIELLGGFSVVRTRHRYEVRTKSRKSSGAELSVAEPLPGFASGMHEMERGFVARHDTHLQVFPSLAIGRVGNSISRCWKLHLFCEWKSRVARQKQCFVAVAQFIYLSPHLLAPSLLLKIVILLWIDDAFTLTHLSLSHLTYYNLLMIFATWMIFCYR